MTLVLGIASNFHGRLSAIFPTDDQSLINYFTPLLFII